MLDCNVYNSLSLLCGENMYKFCQYINVNFAKIVMLSVICLLAAIAVFAISSDYNRACEIRVLQSQIRYLEDRVREIDGVSGINNNCTDDCVRARQ